MIQTLKWKKNQPKTRSVRIKKSQSFQFQFNSAVDLIRNCSENGESNGSALITTVTVLTQIAKAENEATGATDSDFDPMPRLHFGIYHSAIQCAKIREHDPRI